MINPHERARRAGPHRDLPVRDGPGSPIRLEPGRGM